MEWDQDVVSYSHQHQERVSEVDPEEGNTAKALQSQFRQFLREFREGNVDEHFIYRDALSANYQQGEYWVQVDFAHLNAFSPALSEKLRAEPMRLLPLFESAAQEVVAMGMASPPTREEMHRMQVQLVNLTRQEMSIRNLDAEHISHLVKIPGIVITATKPSCKATRISLMCTNCRAVRTVSSSRAFGNILLPRRCDNSTDEKNDRPCPLDPFIVLPDKSTYVDVQKLKLQESPEDTPTGEMPRHIWLFCERKLVNKVKPGSRVMITGVFKIFDALPGAKDKRGGMEASVRRPYIEVIGIEETNAVEKKGQFLPEEEEQFRELARNPDITTLVAQSIAPAIWGHQDIKKAIACLLFGGSRKHLPGGMKLRGDINVLLLGDPSVAKSQFLKFVHQVAPIGVYTSGKGSSAAGLTASVIKESGEFHLEGGAMVLADGGVVCIDEFDKMREQDRVAIHEAMEQQTISIAKAGITTILNSRTSVLAAANPIFGRYDDMRTTSENIEFETTILSRFDLIFIIRDVKDVERDTNLAKHIMDLHIHTGAGAARGEDPHQNEGPVSPDLLAKYIAFARHRVHPRLTAAAVEMLKNHYVNFRQDAKRRELETGEPSAIPLTVRQLESLVRIAESLAKMELAAEANEDHVQEAVRLFKVATLKAASQGLGAGGELDGNQEFRDAVQKAERVIKRTLPIGSHTSVKRMVEDMMRRNIRRAAVVKALDVMHGRGEIEFRAQRRQVYRKK